MNPSPSVIVAGGGTAGHITPMLAVADAVRRLRPQARITAVGTADRMEARLVPEAGYDLEFIDRVPMPRRPSADLLRLPLRFSRAVGQARRILRRHEADVVLGVGGYVCTPMYLAAAREGIPVVIHEANRRPGLANRVGARRAAVVAAAFPDTPLRGARTVGMPLRGPVAAMDRAAERAAARRDLGLREELPTIVLTGRSLGAAAMNRTVRAVLQTPAWRQAGVQLLHITGRGKQLLDDQGQPVQAPRYHQVEFVDGMHRAYAAADLLVARAGAATVSEAAAVGCPSVFVPLPIGNGEQALNAESLVAADAALLVPDAQFTPGWFLDHVLPLAQDPERLERMSRAASRLGVRDAAEQMARLVLEAAESSQNPKEQSR